jgi:hypothetical protein
LRSETISPRTGAVLNKNFCNWSFTIFSFVSIHAAQPASIERHSVPLSRSVQAAP